MRTNLLIFLFILFLLNQTISSTQITNTLDLLNKCGASKDASVLEQFQAIHCLG